MGSSKVARPSTYSIIAFDPHNGDLGVAVQSKFPAVGAIVPWAKANVGAIATQAAVNVSYGPNGLKLLAEGFSAEETLKKLLADDPQPEVRQAAIVDSKGRVAAHTGEKCFTWAGHVAGNGFSCQGNVLISSKIVEAMALAFEKTSGDLIDKLLNALAAGQAAGGDRRGQQSAALLVVREKGGYEGFTDRYVDLRVDDHKAPIEELTRVFAAYDITMLSRENPRNQLSIDGDIVVTIQRELKRLGFYVGEVSGQFDGPTQKALEDWVNMNNFENRMREPGKIWKSILKVLEERTSQVRV